jgi:cob(I)alamin adenosyltransferase
MTPEEKHEARKEQARLFDYAEKALESGEWDMVIMDEILGSVSSGMVELDRLVQLVGNKPEKPELIMTGRDAAASLIELADYVSDIQAVKHPMNSGVAARIGIEN